jgi:hypothetical protein
MIWDVYSRSRIQDPDYFSSRNPDPESRIRIRNTVYRYLLCFNFNIGTFLGNGHQKEGISKREEEEETGKDEGDGGDAREGETQMAELQHEGLRQEGICEEEHFQDSRVLRGEGGGGNMRHRGPGHDRFCPCAEVSEDLVGGFVLQMGPPDRSLLPDIYCKFCVYLSTRYQ